MNEEKKLYWLVESNADLSNTVSGLSEAMHLIDTDYKDTEPEHLENTQYTLTPVWLTDEEYANLPEE